MRSAHLDNTPAAINSSSPASAEAEEAPAIFTIWSREEISALQRIDLDERYQGMITNTIALMNEWIHAHQNGWYHSQNAELKRLLDTDTDKTYPTEIHHSLDRYLETANKLKKPKNGQVKKRLLPTTLNYTEEVVHVYRTFWGNCTYATFYNFLLSLSRLPADELRDGKDKIYLYALLKFKDQELPRLRITIAEQRQLLIDIDTVMLVRASRHLRSLSRFCDRGPVLSPSLRDLSLAPGSDAPRHLRRNGRPLHSVCDPDRRP